MFIRSFLRQRPLYFFSQGKQDFYKVLGLNRSATKGDIKKAFVKLTQEFHPDKNPDPSAKEKFSKISEAYHTLNDPKKRENYDNYGMSADEQKEYSNNAQGFGDSGFGGFWDQQGGFSSFENMFKDFDDFFNFSETQQKKSRSVKGSDVYVNLNISFLDAVNGSVREVSYKMKDVCGACSGSGCKPGTGPVKCMNCKGKGTINYRQGPMNIQMTCGDCHGQGSVVKHYCGTCRGSGRDIVVMKQSVNIPRGINTGQNLRLSQKGQLGENGGAKGDLIIRVTVKEDKVFRREGYDVHIDKELSITQAVLGTQVEINGLEGNKTIAIPPGISTGSRIKLANQGIRKLAPNQSQRGDFYVNVVVKIPKVLTPRQKKIFEDLRDLEEKNDPKPFGGKKQNVEVKTEKMEETKEESKEDSQEESKDENNTQFKNRFSKWY